MSRQATARQIDAFQLYMYAYDIMHVQRHIESYPTERGKSLYSGTIKAIRFRGQMYHFKPDPDIYAFLIK